MAASRRCGPRSGRVRTPAGWPPGVKRHPLGPLAAPGAPSYGRRHCLHQVGVAAALPLARRCGALSSASLGGAVRCASLDAARRSPGTSGPSCCSLWFTACGRRCLAGSSMSGSWGAGSSGQAWVVGPRPWPASSRSAWRPRMPVPRASAWGRGRSRPRWAPEETTASDASGGSADEPERVTFAKNAKTMCCKAELEAPKPRRARSLCGVSIALPTSHQCEFTAVFGPTGNRRRRSSVVGVVGRTFDATFISIFLRLQDLES